MMGRARGMVIVLVVKVVVCVWVVCGGDGDVWQFVVVMMVW